MLSLEQLRDELNRVSYRPGWRLQVWQHPWEGVWLTVRAELENAYHPGEMVTVSINTSVPPIPDANYFHGWLAHRLSRIELHELREWFRVDGVPIFDPHAEGVNDDPNGD